MKFFFNTLIVIVPLFCNAQKQGNIWYFGDHAGLDFNSGSPVLLTNGQTYSPDGTTIEGSAVISDSSGSLLFYTNGNKIWNKNHQVMPNGDNILSNFSSTQAALIVAQPGSSRYFYVFTVDDFHVDNLQYGFRYSIVDICLDNSLGDVIPNLKNIKLLDIVCEKLTAVRHANGTDYWIIVHKYYSDAFYSYHLSSSGIVDTVISHIGSRHPVAYGPQNTGYALGYLKASPNGQKLCVVSGNGYGIAEYFDFDKSTGIVSNPVNIQTDSIYSYYGVSFSPDNSKLYIVCWLNNNGIYQFNLNAGAGNPDSVKASKIKIAGQSPSHWAMQLGPDGKIYIATGGAYLSVINNPNNLGLNCNYADSGVPLYGNIINDSGLPNFIDSYSYSNTKYNCTTSTTPCPITVNSTSVCFGNSSTLTASGSTTYYWSNGAIGNSITVFPSFTTFYTVTGIDGNNCISTAVSTITVNNLTVTANASANTVCAGSSVTLTSSGANSYSWTGGVNNGISFIPGSTHTYTVTGTDTNNCSNTATTTINVNALPMVTANASATKVCAGGSVMLTGTSTPLSAQINYSWTGEVIDGVGFVLASTKTYTVTGTDANNCTNTDTTTIKVIPILLTTIGLIASATTVCSGASVTLTGTGASSYLWSNGSTASVITVLNSGNYWVQDNTKQCSNKDSITITVNQTPTINLGNDITICEGQTITLNGGSATAYLWSNGSTNSSINISTSGIFWLQANNQQCSDRDTISVSIENCETEITVPNVFTPNNDGVNDVFTITTKNITSLTCKIYNRWGILITELTKINEGWDGLTVSGLQCTNGVYYCIVEFQSSDGTNNVKKGFLQLIR